MRYSKGDVVYVKDCYSYERDQKAKKATIKFVGEQRYVGKDVMGKTVYFDDRDIVEKEEGTCY